MSAPRRARRLGAPRILQVTRVFAPEPVAAAFREEALARALQDAGARLRVLTSSDGAHPAAVDEPVRDVRRWPVKRDRQGQVRGYVSYLSFDVPAFFRVLLHPGRVDAVISEPPPTTGLAVMAACALRRVPYVFYAADVWSDATDSVEGVPTLVRRAVRLAEVTVWRRAAAVLTISPGVNRRVQALSGGRARAVMIGNGIDTETFAPDGDPADEVGPYFLYAGTVSEWQGADVFLAAFARVRARRDDVRLVFYSEGSGREELERMAREQGIGGVEFRDKVAPRVIARAMRGAVAGLSSITPGQGYEFALPTKIYAATACGTPVIHAGEGAAHDRIADAHLGWACRYDPQEVALAMEAALAGRERPAAADLRAWTLEHASLQTSAERGAREVLATAAR